MKKSILIIAIFLFFLSGCGMYIGEEKSEDFKTLSYQYDAYLDYDISEEKEFFELINQTMIEIMPSVVKVEARIFSNLNILLETRISSGVIYNQKLDEYFILIDQNQTKILPGQKIEFRVIDYMNNTHIAKHLYSDQTEPLTIISITSKYYHLKTIDISSHLPKIGEPVLLLGNHFSIQNATSMGLITAYRADLKRMYTSIPSDTLSHGGAIINNQLNLVGIQIELDDNQSIFITTDAILTVINYFEMSGQE